MSEWMSIPDLADEQPEKRLHVERYQYAASVLGGLSVIDCACGMGYGSKILSEACSVIGVDLDPEAIAEAQRRYPTVGFMEGDIYRVPFEDFDALVSFETLEHLENPETVIARLPAKLTQIIASVPIRPTVGWNPWHRSDFTEDSFCALLETNGFRIVHEHPQIWVDSANLYLMLHGKR